MGREDSIGSLCYVAVTSLKRNWTDIWMGLFFSFTPMDIANRV
jgi:hypothetical protein